VKKAFIVIKFFQEYWAEIYRCAQLTAELWLALVGFAKKLAEELKREAEEKEQTFDKAFKADD
jgi:hypothetical protein